MRDILVKEGIIFHANKDWSKIDKAPCISYCNGKSLELLEDIRKHTDVFIFVNCMTFLFPLEKTRVKEGLITHELYQRQAVMDKLLPQLLSENQNIIGNTVKPYFDISDFPFHTRDTAEHTRACKFGRISRDDPGKFNPRSMWIYNTMVAPQLKEGLMLGVNDKVKEKIGSIPPWIQHHPAGGMTQQDFYKFCNFIIQPCDPNHTENLPRISFEAMASGSLLIVDNKGGFKDQIIHGETGWLCSDEKEYVYYASRAAYELKESEQMRKHARFYLEDNWGESSVIQEWKAYFQSVGVL